MDDPLFDFLRDFFQLPRRKHHHHCIHVRVRLMIDNVGFELKPLECNHMNINATVGQVFNLSIQYLDANGNVLTGITPDAVPVWTDPTPAVASLVPAADGNTAVLTALTVGTDAIGLSLSVAGVAFTAAAAVTVTAAQAAVASIQIVATPK